MTYLDQFKNYLEGRYGKSSATLKNYLADIRKFIAWFEEKESLPFYPSLINLSHLESFRAQASEQSVSSSERYLSSLRKYFAFLKESNYLKDNPFSNIPTPTDKPDPYHLKNFKNSLYNEKVSEATFKNYLLDIQQFLVWLDEVTTDNHSYIVSDKNSLDFLSPELLEEYKYRLSEVAKLSQSSINRKLSSLRKYLSFLLTQDLIETFPFVTNLKEYEELEPSLPILNQADQVVDPPVTDSAITQIDQVATKAKASDYSAFGPLRLTQRLFKGGNYLFDFLLILPMVKLIEQVEYLLIRFAGKSIFTAAETYTAPATLSSKVALKAITPVFSGINTLETVIQNRARSSQVRGVHHFITREKRTAADFGFRTNNFPKAMYAPINIASLPLSRRILHHLRYTRPDWYRKYHSYALSHYFHFALLMIIVTALGAGLYNGVFNRAKDTKTLAALPTAPPRILSFQGRLTNSSDNPVTATSNLRFAIYNDPTATGAALLWQEVKSVSPDLDGIFNAYLGQGTPIPASLFAQNASLYLGVSVGSDSELAPRQQIATVAYATNAETLQGLPPSTAIGAGTSNVVLALDSSGNLTIGGSASPTFQASGGQFRLSGQPLVLTTNTGSNGNITINPDGTGKIDVQKAFVNTGSTSPLATAQGAVSVDDLFAVNATSSGQSAVTINQDGTGPLISASASGLARFTVDNTGNGTFNGSGAFGSNLAVNGGSITSSNTTGSIFNNNVSTLQIGGDATSLTLGGTSGTLNLRNPNLNLGGGSATTLQTTGNTTLTLGGSTTGDLIVSPQNGATGGTLRPSTNNQVDLGTPSFAYRTLYVGSIITPTGTFANYWQRNNNALSPANITDDVLLGGIATASATVRLGATTGANSFFNTGGNLGIGTATPLYKLDVAGNLNLSTGSTYKINGTDVLSASTLGSGVTSSSLTTLGTITTGTWNASTISTQYGGTGANLSSATQGSIPYFSAAGVMSALAPGTSGYVLMTNGTGANPSWTNAASLGTNYWQLNNAAISPSISSYDVLVGGNATASALIKLGGTANSNSFFNTGGNVGIGTSSPTAANLQFGASTTAAGGISFGGDTTLYRSSAGNLTTDGNFNAVTSLQTGGTFEALRNNALPQRFYISNANDPNVPVLYVNSSGQITMNSQGAQPVRFNYDKGTGGVIFGNGALGETARFTSGGSLGIGTTNPLAVLHVSGGNQGGNAAAIFNQVGATTNDILSASSSGVSKFSVTNSGGIRLGASEGTAGQCLLSGGVGVSASWGACAGSSQWITSGSDIYYNTGNVGIGQTSGFTDKLVVNGNIQASVFRDKENTAYYLDPANTGTSLTLAGNVGIGTTTPTNMLTIKSTFTNGQAIKLDTDATGKQTGIDLSSAGTQKWQIGKNTADDFFIWDAAIGRTDMQIMTGGNMALMHYGGNLGIGTQAPGTLLQVSNATLAARGKALTIFDQYENQDIFTASASGATKFVINNSGNVGIGTAAPGAKLHVTYGAANTTIGTPAIIIDNPSGGTQTDLQFRINNTRMADARADNAGNLVLSGTGTGSTFLAWDGGSGGVMFGNGAQAGVAKMTSAGSLGLATTAPNYTLDVNGRVGINTIAGFGADLNIGLATKDYPLNGAWPGSLNANILLTGLDYTSIAFHDAGARVDGIRVGGGLINIGYNMGWGVANTNVAGSLTFQSALNWQGNQIMNGTDSWLRTYGNTGWYNGSYAGGWNMIDSVYIRNYGDKPLYLTNGQSAHTIEAFSPGGNFVAVVGRGGAGGRGVYGDATNAYGVTGVSTNSWGVYCQGTGCGGNQVWTNTSDERLKTNIQTFPDALSKVLRLRGVTFNWKNPSYPGTNLGFIAQEVFPIVPEVVSMGSDGYYAMQQGPLTALLVNAMQEQQLQIASISASLTSLPSTTTMPELNLSSSGQVVLGENSDNTYAVSANGTLITRIVALAQAVIGNLKAGAIETERLTSKTLSISTDSVTIAGQSLSDYIISVVRQTNLSASINSQPDLTVSNLKTNLISPLASDSAIVMDGRVHISGDNTTKPSLTVSGDASVSGKLTSSSLQTNDATISGTLRAGRIVADDIEGLTARLASLSASSLTASQAAIQNITNVTNIYNTASQSATASSSGQIDPAYQGGVSSILTSPIQTDYANIATLSAKYIFSDSLTSGFGQFTEGLLSLGPTALSNTTINGQLAVGSTMFLADNSLNVTGGTLQIQSLRGGDISFQGGLVAINTAGELSVGGNATFAKDVTVKGTLLTRFLSPIPDEDLTINLPLGTARPSELKVNNASGEAVLAINQQGDVTASGTGFFKQVAANLFNIVRGAQADTSSTETVASSSAGVGMISRNYTERTIYSPFVNEKSLIYVTATSNTLGQTPYVARQVAEDSIRGIKGSFTIAIPQSVSQDISINWWIVN